MSFWVVVFSGYIPTRRIAGSYGSSVLSFIRSLQTALFCSIAVPVYIPINSVRGFAFLHTLSSIQCL